MFNETAYKRREIVKRKSMQRMDSHLKSMVLLMAGFIALTWLSVAGFTQKACAAETLNIMMNGGAYEKLARKLVVEPFEKKYNVQVSITPGSGAQMLTRLRAEKMNPSQDCVVLDIGPAVTGSGEGLFEKIDPANIPNLKDMDELVLDKRGYGPIVHSHSIGLAYNAKMLNKPMPESWMDLWKPAYKDTLLLVNVTLTPGYLFLLQVAMQNGGSYENIDPGIEKIKQ